MTTATAPVPKTRAKRRPAAHPIEQPQSQSQLTCSECGRALGWRDHAYCGGNGGGHKATMCKVCHQKAERRRLHGVYVPRAKLPHAPMQYGTERTAKLTARPAWKAAQSKRAPQLPADQTPRWERSMKRAEKNIRRKANKQARKERAA